MMFLAKSRPFLLQKNLALFSQFTFLVDTAADASDIVAAINSIEKLVTLRLSGNTISPDGAEVISNALSGRDELQHLLLSDIFTGRLKDEIPKAIQFLNNALNYEGTNTRIRTLDLSDNAFGPNGAVAVEPFLNSKACLKLVSTVYEVKQDKI